jgi:F-box-like
VRIAQSYSVSFYLHLLKRQKSASEPSSKYLHVPTEIWLEILSYLSSEDYGSLSLTCRSIRWIAQPLLFRTPLAIYPFLGSVAYRHLQLEPYIARSLERLDFLSLPRIAEQIKEFSVTPYPRGHSLTSSGSPQVHVPENVIVDRVFDVLPHLSNLNTLVIHSIRSTPQRMSVLRNLRLQVFELEIRGDDITWQASESQPSTPIVSQRVVLFNCNASPRQIPVPVTVPLSFLYPNTLEVISTGPNGTESILAAMSSSPTPFPRLQLLDLSVRFISSSHFIMALRQCHKLTSLRLRSAATDSPAHGRPTMATLPAEVIPALTLYHGPPSLAPSFTSEHLLQDVKLWSSRSMSSVRPPTYLAEIIPLLGIHVKVLEIGVTTLPPLLLERIITCLPNLKCLAVNAHLSSYHPGVASMHTTHTTLMPSINISVPGAGKLDLDVLYIGVQLPVVGSPEQASAACEVLSRFPQHYDPTSWGEWEIELPWSRIIWSRLDKVDDDEIRGRLSIEHVEYTKPLFRTRE